MYHSIPYEPFTQIKGKEPNEDGKVERYSENMHWIWGTMKEKGDTLHNLLPPDGTISTTGVGSFDYGTGTEERDRAGREIRNPMMPTEANMKEGKVLFDRFCAVCHGKKGKGDGTVPASGKYPKPPSYDSKTSSELPQGAIYHVITLGQNAMGSYASQILPEDRWKIAMYVQTMQKQGGAPVEEGDGEGDDEEMEEDEMGDEDGDDSSDEGEE